MTETAPADTQEIQGKADRWDDDAILLLALIALGDTVGISRFWDSLAPKRWRGLLLALAVAERGELPETPPQFWFDISTQQFGTTTRGHVPATAIRAAVLAVVAGAQARFRSFTDSLLTAGLAIDEWQAVIAAQIKSLTLSLAAAGRGGVARLTTPDLGRVSDRLSFQFTRLRDFAIQIEDKEKRADTPDKISNRIELYPASAEIAYHEARRISHEAENFIFERRVLHPAEHCAPQNGLPSCPELAALGWVDIGTTPDPGEGTPCLWNCACTKEFLRRATDG